MTKPILPFVEIMITQVCNLSCTGCTNYSDLTHKGYLTWDEGRPQIESWVSRIDIPDFGMIGGEPLLNPDVRTWIVGLRKLMPTSQLRFTTNGIMLDKNFDLLDLFAEIGNCVFKITAHTDVDLTIQRVFDNFKWQPIKEFGISRWITDNGFRFQVNRPDRFIKTYKGDYANMQPYNSIPEEAFKICCQQTCPLIYNGKLYKCSTSGLLADVLAKFDNPNLDQWQPYLIDGLIPTCSDQELNDFLANFNKPHLQCGQCPSDSSGIINHADNILEKKIVPSNIRRS
jgi:hypothetical protein